MATEAEKRRWRCCFTGNRPEKLQMPEYAVKAALEKEIRQAIYDGFSVFISGMARGVDIWAAETVLRVRNTGEAIRLICACPYQGFEQGWGKEWQEQYRKILAAADLVKYISPSYSRSCFQIRNEWMVDHAARVIAVFNGEKSGTKNTIDYARKVGVPVILLILLFSGCSRIHRCFLSL